MTELIDNPPPLEPMLFDRNDVRQIEAAAFARGVSVCRNAVLDDVAYEMTGLLVYPTLHQGTLVKMSDVLDVIRSLKQ